MKANKASQIGDFISKGNEFMIVAKEHDDKNEYDDALRNYKLAIEYFDLARKYETSKPRLKVVYTKMDECLTRAETLRKFVEDGIGKDKEKDAASSSGATKRKSKDKDNEDGDNSSDKVEVNGNDVIISSSPNVRFDDIIGLAETKKLLQAALVWPIKFASIYKANNTNASRSMLLYGPPGTGKTQLAKAIATEMNCTFIAVSASDIMSKWLGDSEKKMRSVFETARKRAPSVIFFDEVDAILSSRSESSTSEASKKVQTELLTNMDGFGGIADKDKHVFVLGATNNPKMLDVAVVRRFHQRLYIPLPDEEARALMFARKFELCVHSLTADDYKTAASSTEGYSGADIETVVRHAKESALRKYADSDEFYATPDGKYVPVKYADAATNDKFVSVKKKFNDMTQEEVVVLPIVIDDVIDSIRRNKPSTSVSNSKQYDDFTSQFGAFGN